MNNLLTIVTALCILKYLLTLIGSDAIGRLLYYKIYNRIANNEQLTKYHAKRAEYQEAHKEKLSISAQDQYAKWTKLNRKCDKLKKEIADAQQLIVEDESRFLKNSSFFLKFVDYAPLLFIRVWYRKLELLVLPKGMFPWLIEFYLSFPSVTRGCISLGGWIFVINSVLNGMGFIVKTMFFTEAVTAPAKANGVADTNIQPVVVVAEPKVVELPDEEPKIEAVE